MGMKNFVASTTSSRRPWIALPTISSERPAEEIVGGVDEVDASVEGAVDDADRVVLVVVAPRAEHHGAEGERADLHSRAAEQTVFHHSSLCRSSHAAPQPSALTGTGGPSQGRYLRRSVEGAAHDAATHRAS
jgi:hypothetical protein